MNEHLKAILQQLPQEERQIYEKDPGRAWLTQMGERFSNMSVPDAVAALRSESNAVRNLPQIPPTPAQAAAPLQSPHRDQRTPTEPHEPTASAQPAGQTATGITAGQSQPSGTTSTRK